MITMNFAGPRCPSNFKTIISLHSMNPILLREKERREGEEGEKKRKRKKKRKGGGRRKKGRKEGWNGGREGRREGGGSAIFPEDQAPSETLVIYPGLFLISFPREERETEDNVVKQ